MNRAPAYGYPVEWGPQNNEPVRSWKYKEPSTFHAPLKYEPDSSVIWKLAACLIAAVVVIDSALIFYLCHA
jgi:hypothetical protein